MTDIFVHGTLRDPVLRSRIGQGSFNDCAAVLSGHRVLRQRDAALPYLCVADGSTCAGVLLRGVSLDQMQRLDTYEAAFNYSARQVTVTADGQDVQAMAYFPGAGVKPGARDWSFAEWDMSLGPLARAAANEIGSYDPPLGKDALRRQWAMIEARAAARLRAAETPAPATLRQSDGQVDMLSQGPLWGGFFKAGKITLRHSTFQGGRSPALVREYFNGTDAAILLPYDPVSDHVLLVEQIRMGPLIRGAQNPWLLEPVAGIVDARETPEQSALREAKEEAALEHIRLEKMFSFYASPGNSTDYFNCYLGLCNLPQAYSYTGGLAAEAEDLRLHIIPFARAFALIETGEAQVGPLIAMLLWLDRNRERLRDAA